MRRTVNAWVVAGLVSVSAGFVEAASTEGKKGLLALGSEAPDFELPDVVSGQTVSLDDVADQRALLVVMVCRHCPYVQHVKEGLADLADDYADQDLAIVGISSNDPADFPDDAPESLKEMAQEAGWTFPVCFDETQEVGKAYTAVATPDFFVFDAQRRLVYRGRFDGSRPGGSTPVTGEELRAALDAVLAGEPVSRPQKPSFGCSIKWKPGKRPLYL